MKADLPPTAEPADSGTEPRFQSLKQLLDYASGKSLGSAAAAANESGLTELLPFPFLALVGQPEMKLALLLSLVNPNVNGVLLVGPRGTGKSTAVRSLLDLLPQVQRSTCYYGCMPEDVETGGLDAICPDCAKKYAAGEPLAQPDRVRLIELPLNVRVEDVVGGMDESPGLHERMRIRRGILAQADQNLLYIDEVNLLADEIVDVILDAAAQGIFTVRRGALSASYRSRFVLIGSMNPEEGKLRPQILDRFGLRVLVQGLGSAEERLEAYQRVRAYLGNPRAVIQQFSAEISAAAEEIREARNRLPSVRLPEELAREAIGMIQQLKIDSLRAEITLFEAARAHCAADGRTEVSAADLVIVAPMALRMRRSTFMNAYFDWQQKEEQEISALLGCLK